MKGVVIVGAGGFGRLWIPALKRRGLIPAAIVDPDGKSAEEFALDFRLRPRDVVCELDEALQRESGLVIDSAPPAERVTRVMRALEQGRDVLAAKPLAWCAEDVRRIERAATRAGRRVFVAMQKRYLPAFQQLRRILPSLGPVGYVGLDLQVDGRAWEPGMSWRQVMRLPSLYEGAIHHLDLLLWLFDLRVREIRATAWNPPWSAFPSADFSAVLRCERELTIHYLSRWAARSAPFSAYFSGLRVEGAHGTASVSNGELSVDGKSLPGIDPDGLQMDLEVLNDRLLGDVVAALSGSKVDTRLDAGFHVRVLELADSIAAAIERDGARDT